MMYMAEVISFCLQLLVISIFIKFVCIVASILHNKKRTVNSNYCRFASYFIYTEVYFPPITTVTTERAGIDNAFKACLPMYCKSLSIEVTYNFPFLALSHAKEIVLSMSA